MGKLFGTDGVRGVANKELTPLLAFQLGRAGASVLTKENNRAPKILIGKDTRISGDMLEAALTAGMCSVGARVISVGVIPTPAVAYLVKHYNLDAGVVISASHNPFEDNGIKFFSSQGYKLSDELENEIEDIILNVGLDSLPVPVGENVGCSEVLENADDDYINFLKNTVGGKDLSGLKIAIDCANGATYQVAPVLFFELGADVLVMHNEPDGKNINDKCGSTHMDDLIKFVIENKCDLGLAFDGDGDRCLAVDENGEMVDGDEIMAICAIDMLKKKTLKKDTVVATVMSNLGFFLMGEKENIKMEQTKVGDRYVLEKMLECGYNIGGEQSGHVIFLDHNTTGDGILTGLTLAELLKRNGEKLSKLAAVMEKLPQVLINAKVSNERKNDYLTDEKILKEISELDKKFAGKGRVLIRPSGTEPKVRVMIEGKNIDEITTDAKRIAKLLEDTLK